MLAGSPVALTMALCFYSNPVMAQVSTPTSASDTAIEQVVVTGTSIRGLEPVGADLTTVDSAQIQAMAPQSMQDILANVPSLMGFGNTGEGQLYGVAFQPSIHGMGASASNSTLTLVDAHRITGTGTTHTDYDPNIVPVNMIERVDVLADGASSIYGTDAVAGVVNFITRSKFDGLQLNGQVSTLHGATNWEGGVLLGKTWSDGSVILGYTHSYEGALSNLDRPYTATTNFIPFGGTNFNTFACDPATIQPGGTGNIYTSPTSGIALANTAANSPCSAAAYGQLLPVTTRDNVMLKGSVDLNSSLTISSDLIFSNHAGSQEISRGTVTATVFQTGSQANPFYVTPAGYTGTATKETIRWDADQLLGPGAKDDVGAQDFLGDINTQWRIGNNFAVNFLAQAGTDTSYDNTYGKVNGSVAYAMLNGTDNAGGSTTYVVPGINQVIPAVALTTTNALDVWNPAATNRTNPAILSQLSDNANLIKSVTSFELVQLGADGTLFDFPAGPVKVAFGGQYKRDHEDAFQTSSNNTGVGATLASSVQQYGFRRDDYAYYAELDIPVISSAMQIPLVQKFELNLSGRYDDYSDVGTTSNPKGAFNWQVIDSLKIRGNMATSFVAPPLDVTGERFPGYLYGINQTSSYGSGSLNANVPLALFPLVAQLGIPGCTAASVTCNTAGLTGISVGANAYNIKPQHGRTWSLGADFTPDFLPGLTSSFTYWDNSLTGGFTSPALGAKLNNASLAPLTLFYPGCATATQINQYTAHLPATSALPACTQFISLGYTGNYLNLYAQGIDASVNYIYDTDLGTFKGGLALTEIVKFDQSYGSGGVLYSVLNTSGANNTFPSIATQARVNAGWSKDAFSVDVFVNFTGSYRNWTSSSAIPVVDNSIGEPIGGGDKVSSSTTVDLHLAYAFDGGVLGGDEISLTENNLFNSSPPFYNDEDGRSDGFDHFVGNVLGRVSTVALTAKF